MDPDTGASTWALGSQLWNINIGNFTRKANTQKENARPPSFTLIVARLARPGPFVALRVRAIINRGREAKKV